MNYSLPLIFAAAISIVGPCGGASSAPTDAAGATAAGVVAAAISATGPTASGAGPSAQGYHHMVDVDGDIGILLLGGFLSTDLDEPRDRVWAFSVPTGWSHLGVTGAPTLYDADYDSGSGVVLLLTGDTPMHRFDPVEKEFAMEQGAVPFDQQGARLACDAESDRMIAFGPDGGTWAYELATGTWTDMAPELSPPPRGWHAMTYDPGTDRVVMFGGMGYRHEYFGDTCLYDFNSNIRTEVSSESSPTSRAYGASSFDPSTSQVIPFGGVFGPFLSETALDDTWAFDVAAKSWTALAPSSAPSARGWHALAHDSLTGLLVLFGGGPTRDHYLPDTWLYDPSANRWAPAQPQP